MGFLERRLREMGYEEKQTPKKKLTEDEKKSAEGAERLMEMVRDFPSGADLAESRGGQFDTKKDLLREQEKIREKITKTIEEEKKAVMPKDTSATEK